MLIAQTQTITVQGPDTVEQLAALGLTPEILRNALLAGLAARNEATRNDPATSAGYNQWGRTVRGLRDQLVGNGWRRSESRGISSTVSPDKSFAIIVATGDEFTGLDEKVLPDTKRARGAAGRHLIKTNQQLTLLFDEGPQNDASEADDEEVDEEKRKTWLLLTSLNAERTELRAELSLPADVTDEGLVCGWAKRILLEPIQLDPQLDLDENDDQQSEHKKDDDAGDDLVVDVRRKT